jgi:predicted nuclease with TOPRIM domain
MTDPLMLMLVFSAFAALICLVQITLAVRHDAVATAAGPMEDLEVLEQRRIRLEGDAEEVKAEIARLEAEAVERRTALQNISAIEAEADAAQRRLDGLRAEWAGLEESKQALRLHRDEVDRSVERMGELKSDISQAEEVLAAHKDKLARLDRLEERLATGPAELAALEAALAERRDELRSLQDARDRLRDAERKLTEAQRRTHDIETSIGSRERDLETIKSDLAARRVQQQALSAQLDELRADHAAVRLARDAAAQENARLAAQNARLEDGAADLRAAQAQLAPLRAELDAAKAETAALDNARREIADLDANRGRLEARIAHLTAEEARHGGGEAPDPLRDLMKLPAALAALKGAPDSTAADEADALRRVAQRIEGQGLVYHPRTLHAFHTAMKVNETTQMAVLAGISGTGKSQLPRQYAAGMGIGLLQVPVQPRWDSPQDLMGFYNYIEGRFRPTDLAQALYHMDALNNPDTDHGDRMLLVLLDEMNLARVEYYFSDFLSRLESRPNGASVRTERLRKDAEIELEIVMKDGKRSPRIFPGYNLLFAGTMNEDESTQTLSDKVVDRANLLRFPAPKTFARAPAGPARPAQAPEVLPWSRWKTWVQPGLSGHDTPNVDKTVIMLADIMRDMNRPFGHRLERAIKHYVANYQPIDGGDRVNDALADQVEMRLLPKLRGVELDQGKVESAFADLQRLAENQLHDLHLSAAIKTAVEQSRDANGRFAWSGVTR